MNRRRLQIAVAEAKRFLARAEALPPEVETAPGDYSNFFTNNHPKETGAIRRASMDLTRALADLRKSDP